MKKIGEFLKSLRKDKGLTQEQLAEVFCVSGRTISRWETGTNMPDLSILIQLAEFYNVEVKEILNGERKSENMNKELKETLSKVADYNELKKEKVMKAGNAAFGIIFAVCVTMIVVQLLATGNLILVAGETVILLVGGIAYIGIMIFNGVWEDGSKVKSTAFTDTVISLICAVIFAVILVACYIRMGANKGQAVQMGLLFWIVISVLEFVVLRILAYFNYKRKKEIVDKREIEAYEKEQPVNVFIADGNLQAEMIITAMNNNEILAYKQDLGDAGYAAVKYGMGRGINDRVAIMVESSKKDRAIQVLEEMGLK